MNQNATIAGTAHGAARAASNQSDERCDGCALRGAKLCRAIWASAPPNICRPIIRTFERGQLIVEPDDAAGFLAVIRRGYARRSMMRMSGKRVLLGLAVPGDIVGGPIDGTFASDFEAASDVEICLYNRVIVKQQMQQDGRFMQLLIEELDEQHNRLLRKLWRDGTLNSRERILAFLVSAAEIMPTEALPDGSLILKMEIERRDWADLTNTAAETISRTLRYLEEKALITSLTPYRFRIHNLDRLASLASIELKAKRKVAGDRPAEAAIQGGSRQSFRGMTAVNAAAARPDKLGTVRQTMTAPRCG